MNGTDRQRRANMLEAARLRALDRMERSFGTESPSDLLAVLVERLDVLIVAQWFDNAPTEQTRGPMGFVKRHGPALGVGSGLGAIAIALIEAVGQVLGK